MDMLERVQSTLEKYNMAIKGESLLCCLSGGADSVALLLCLHECGFSVKVCHVNHQLRGEESFRDEAFCTELCRRLGIEINVTRVDAAAYAAQNGMGVEEGARKLRYEIFAAQGCDRIATAHTLSDCIETAVFNLARGTGLAGVASIPPVRGSIIRPLIECTRSEVEQFLTARGQEWVTDSTNLSDDYTRNRIRHYIVPELRRINPSLEKTARATFSGLREDNRLLMQLGGELFERAYTQGGLDCGVMSAADSALSARAAGIFLEKKGAPKSRENILAVVELCCNGGRATLGGGLAAHTWRGRLYAEIPQPPQDIELIGCPGKEYDFFEKKVLLEITDILQESENVHKNVTKFFADYGKIKGEIMIRNRRGGDCAKFIGRGCTVSLKKLFQSEIPESRRGRVVILADDCGVIFAEGYGFVERVRADSGTKTLLHCKIS